MASGIRKAALLLMSLDPNTAGELLKSAKPETITQIAAEVAYLNASGASKAGAAAEPVKEFLTLLNAKSAGGGSSVRGLLESAVGREKSAEMMTRVQSLVDQRDPFGPIRSAEVAQIAQSLQGESAQVAAIVLSELPPSKSAALLGLLGEAIRAEAVKGMAGGQSVAPETCLRVAAVVRHRLAEIASATGAVAGVDQRQVQLRKVAVLLRGLAVASRDSLLKAITEQDADSAAKVQTLMVLWDDIPLIADRALQEALRGVDSRSLAMALFGAASEINTKLRANMSERGAAMLDEEASLLNSPKKDDVEKAREQMLTALRKMNAAGSLSFIE